IPRPPPPRPLRWPRPPAGPPHAHCMKAAAVPASRRPARASRGPRAAGASRLGRRTRQRGQQEPWRRRPCCPCRRPRYAGACSVPSAALERLPMHPAVHTLSILVVLLLAGGCGCARTADTGQVATSPASANTFVLKSTDGRTILDLRGVQIELATG